MNYSLYNTHELSQADSPPASGKMWHSAEILRGAETRPLPAFIFPIWPCLPVHRPRSFAWRLPEAYFREHLIGEVRQVASRYAVPLTTCWENLVNTK